MQKLYLSIPEPCHENWQAMTVTEQGRFCNACAKEVVDLSMMTDTEVLNYFTTTSFEKVCGRTLPSQLERTISYPQEPKKRLFWYWNYIVMFIMFFSKTNTAKAQSCSKPITELNPVKSNTKQTQVRLGSMKIKGPDPLLVVNGTIVTNFDNVNIDDIEDVTVLQGSAATAIYGSEGANGAIIITTKLKVKNLDTVTVKADPFLTRRVDGVLGGVGIRGIRVTGYADTKTKIVTRLTDSLKLYPNPVEKGYPIFVSLKVKEAGNYYIQVMDAIGRIVLQKQINIPSKEYMEQVQTNSMWAAGIYNMNVFNNKNKLISKLSFIVK
ncbi:MAG TPA: T9SS type A sorting domain-containing protein [Ferruginibacter sp.]|nr:T9SS type A sorting domain-containing protein [Ferruginibacter sp.]